MKESYFHVQISQVSHEQIVSKQESWQYINYSAVSFAKITFQDRKSNMFSWSLCWAADLYLLKEANELPGFLWKNMPDSV